MTLSRQVCVGRAECQHNATSKNNRTPYGKTYVLHCVATKGATLDGQFLPHKPKKCVVAGFRNLAERARSDLSHLPSPLVKLVALDN